MASKPQGHTYTPATDDSPGTVVLDVRHLDTDSYSRSVDRAAMSWARTVGARYYPRYSWSLVAARYATRTASQAPNGRPWCVSELTFRLSR